MGGIYGLTKRKSPGIDIMARFWGSKDVVWEGLPSASQLCVPGVEKGLFQAASPQGGH